jgi:hypothetical protein
MKEVFIIKKYIPSLQLWRYESKTGDFFSSTNPQFTKAYSTYGEAKVVLDDIEQTYTNVPEFYQIEKIFVLGQ